LKGKAGYRQGKQREKGEKKGKEEREKQKEGTVYGVVFLLLLMGPIGRGGIETCVIPGSYSSLKQHVFPVNPDETPYPATRVGEVK
jgi:hypothetical protein